MGLACGTGGSGTAAGAVVGGAVRPVVAGAGVGVHSVGGRGAVCAVPVSSWALAQRDQCEPMQYVHDWPADGGRAGNHAGASLWRSLRRCLQRPRKVGMSQRSSFRYRSMAAAAMRPSLMACTTSDAPRTASPQAKTPSWDVIQLLTATLPRASSFRRSSSISPA